MESMAIIYDMSSFEAICTGNSWIVLAFLPFESLLIDTRSLRRKIRFLRVENRLLTTISITEVLITIFISVT